MSKRFSDEKDQVDEAIIASETDASNPKDTGNAQQAQDKPREFWISMWDWKTLEQNNLWGVDGIATVVSEKPESFGYHVIEYSAFEYLQWKLEQKQKVVKELNCYSDNLADENAALKDKLARAEAELWVAKDSQLRTYDGMVQKADRADDLEKENAELKERLASATARWNKAEDRICYILEDSQELEQENAALRTRIKKLRAAIFKAGQNLTPNGKSWNELNEALTADDALAKGE